MQSHSSEDLFHEAAARWKIFQEDVLKNDGYYITWLCGHPSTELGIQGAFPKLFSKYRICDFILFSNYFTHL